MLRVLLVCACVTMLFGCGSTTSISRDKNGVIAAALLKLQAEVERGNRDLRRKVGPNVLGTLTLVKLSPPHGVSAAEWNAAVKNDHALQRALKSSP
jgi:hypothetical protein